MADTKTVYHPNLPNVSNDVPVGDVDAWKDAGWRLTQPKEKPDEGEGASLVQ